MIVVSQTDLYYNFTVWYHLFIHLHVIIPSSVALKLCQFVNAGTSVWGAHGKQASCSCRAPPMDFIVGTS